MNIHTIYVCAVALLCSSEAFQGPSQSSRRRITPNYSHPSPPPTKKGGELGTNDGVPDDDETRIYFDISIADERIGRMVFNLKDSERLLPLHAANLVQLCTGAVRSVDSRCTYIGCQFRHSPQFVERLPQYRWAHTCDGRGRNAVRGGADRISEPERLAECRRPVYGGAYYGLECGGAMGGTDGGGGVVLTVPLVGAYRGSTGFSIVRVGESPREWRERLLLQSAVLGYLEEGMDVLRTMAGQTTGPPVIVACGRIG